MIKEGVMIGSANQQAAEVGRLYSKRTCRGRRRTHRAGENVTLTPTPRGTFIQESSRAPET
ncbi:MAG: hypothetical protein DMF95_22740 [Acidobacteria bacterium]|nr:MAG: hypothetical protein DMF95_22740 [Acidobacteriota bacterium]